MSNNLKAKRVQAGYKQEEVAKLLKIKQCSISNWECGRYLPNTNNLLRLSKIYNCTVEELYQVKE